MNSLEIDQQCFLMNLLPLPPPIPKGMQIQCNESDSILALSLAVAEYPMTGPELKFIVFARVYSISHSTVWRWTREVMLSESQYKWSRISSGYHSWSGKQSYNKIWRLTSVCKTYIGPFQDLLILSKRKHVKEHIFCPQLVKNQVAYSSKQLLTSCLLSHGNIIRRLMTCF